MSIEILQVVNAISRDKNIASEAIIEALESALKVAARKQYGYDKSIQVRINRTSGAISVFRNIFVVSDDEDEGLLEPQREVEEETGEAQEVLVADSMDANTEHDTDGLQSVKKEEAPTIFYKMPLKYAAIKYDNPAIGDIIKETLPPLDTSRVLAHSVKHIIISKVRDLEMEKQYEEYKHRLGDIVSGVVEKVELHSYIVKLGTAEALLKKEHTLKSDVFKVGDRVRAYLSEIRKFKSGPQLVLSRTHNNFLKKLFFQEVPEVYNGIVEVKAVARDPGVRAKVAVYTNDASIDPVGSCVGVRGYRIQAIVNEIGGEKIDVIQWSPNPATFVINAIAPAEVIKVVIEEEKKKIEIVVPDDNLSIAIGRGGQNVRLASDLIGWRLDIVSESDDSKSRVEEFNSAVEVLVSNLELDEILGQLLVSEGYTDLDAIALASPSSIAAIEGLDENIAEELIKRAKICIETKLAEQIISKDSDVHLIVKDKALADRLVSKKVKTVLDLADLSSDDFTDIIPDSGLAREAIDSMIMEARNLIYFKKGKKS